MSFLASLLVGLLVAMVAYQALFSLVFVRLFYRQPLPTTVEVLPRVSILLSLRGADPHLAFGLEQ